MSASLKTERPAPCWRGPPGGLFGIDQEVVTLRGLSRHTPGPGAT